MPFAPTLATPCLILTLRGDFSRNINFENLPDDLLDEALELQVPNPDLLPVGRGPRA